jgi:hypothetical protein
MSPDERAERIWFALQKSIDTMGDDLDVFTAAIRAAENDALEDVAQAVEARFPEAAAYARSRKRQKARAHHEG